MSRVQVPLLAPFPAVCIEPNCFPVAAPDGVGGVGGTTYHRGAENMTKTVAIGGLGAIGLKLARALDAGVDGLQLIAVAARDEAKAQANVEGFRSPPRIVALAALAEADIVGESAPAAVFEKSA